MKEQLWEVTLSKPRDNVGTVFKTPGGVKQGVVWVAATSLTDCYGKLSPYYCGPYVGSPKCLGDIYPDDKIDVW